MSELYSTALRPLRSVIDDLRRVQFGDGASLHNAVRVPPEAYAALPPIIKDLVDVFDRDVSREIVLAAALPALSAAMPNVEGWYGGQFCGPQIYVGLVAPAGTGKGAARHAKDLVKGADCLLREELASAHGEGEAGIAEGPVLFLPVNSSAAAMIEHMGACNVPYLAFDTEQDVLVSLMKQDWGQVSHLLRQAFEREDFAARRKGTYVHVERPRLSLFLSGTEDQFLSMFGDGIGNGLYSRFAWLWVPAVDEWITPRPDASRAFPDEVVAELSDRVKDLYGALLDREAPLKVELEEHQWDLIDEVYRSLKARARTAGYGAQLDSVLHRSGAIAFRTAATLGVLRGADRLAGNHPDISERLVLTDTDVENALTLGLVHLDHSVRLHALLPARTAVATERPGDAERFLDALPEEFKRAEALEVGTEMGFSVRFCDEHLKAFYLEGRLDKVKRGYYAKPD